MFLGTLGILDLWVICLTAVWLSAAVWLAYRRPKLHLPPGPRPLPLAGNVFQVPKDKDYVLYAEWARRYGPIFTLKLIRQRIIILSSQKVVTDILEKNMNATSGRPLNMIMASELVGWGRAVALHAGGPQHQKYRRLLSTSLNSTAVRRYRALQEQAARSLLKLFLDTPKDFLQHIRHTIGLSLVEITYGRDIKIRNKTYVEYAELVGDVFIKVAKPYAYLVDLIPAMKLLPRWMPGTRFLNLADQWRRDLDDLVQAPIDEIKGEINDGDAPNSYVADLLKGRKASLKTEEEDIMWTAASLYGGGSDTSICALMAFVLLMCLYPEKQRLAHQEIDEVIGGDHLPTFEDQDNLPYVNALVKEVLRYWTIVPLGLPHRVVKDEVYGEYIIPAGSTVMGNIWAMMHDETVYTKPFDFLPERFLPKSAGGLEEPEPASTVFGWGRRICPGLHLAEASLWIYAANILAAMNIAPVKNGRGEALPPVEEGIPGLINCPRPYECSITVRSPSVEALIAR